jgi:hypothetical protein
MPLPAIVGSRFSGTGECPVTKGLEAAVKTGKCPMCACVAVSSFGARSWRPDVVALRKAE